MLGGEIWGFACCLCSGIPFTCSEAHSRNGGSYPAPQGQNPILFHHLFLGIGAKKVQGAGGQGRGQRMAVLFSLDNDKGAAMLVHVQQQGALQGGKRA